VPKWAKADVRTRLALGAEIPRHVKLLEFPPESLVEPGTKRQSRKH
jgi:hypothetical protein